MTEKKEKKEKKGLSTQAVVLIIAALLIVAGTAVALVLLLNKEEPPEEEPATGAQVMTEANYRQIQEETQEKVARGMFATHFSTSWSFPDGKSASSNAVMGNSSANQFPFYFTVTLQGTGELVYTSGLLPVGTEIEELILDTELPAGTYPASLGIHMIDDEGEPVEGNTVFNITLEIEN
jgi:hypothetical protein